MNKVEEDKHGKKSRKKNIKESLKWKIETKRYQ